jgi:hypothetical protein
VRDLPEFMAEPEFLRRFGGVGAPPYRQMMADIEQRIARRWPLYRWGLIRAPVAKIRALLAIVTQGKPCPRPNTTTDEVSADPVEKIVPLMPIVLPVAGGVLMLLLAFIAVFMA